ncbi:hypothetical protein WN48_10759 [Eufriesea mexicana]|uniref:CFAP65 tenth Ig-like domain-containing protein n=1 Tax=Eufriesea mexicana TaxID=516756 RepID=A0A310SHR6_9HYME|nr:hypothetical protein WN48_10759 [Eufriesea mexicana]
MKVIKLDYGDVEIGKTAMKTIEIWNESYKEQIYQVQRDPTTNPLDYVFHLRSYTWTLGPDEKFLCEINYRPLVASKNVDYFIIIDSNGTCLKIITYGYAIELYGYCSSVSIKKDNIDSFTYPWKEKNGFKGYLRDVIDTLGDIPPVSLSRHYFNFGQVDVNVENIQKISHSICLTNHTNSSLLITWEKDTDEIFNITPSEMLIHANQSTLFELTFNPNVKSHSFPVTSNGWIPQYEIPQTIIMPPCVPSYPIYTTFLIKKFGHLPLMFQFVSPPASHFIVKPMLGVIYQDYQIIVVGMTSKPQNEQIYVERWTIYFNGNTKNESYIDFKGYAEYANIVFSNNNVLNFPTTMSGCQQFLQLGMRNVTRHRIKYQFYQLPPELDMQHMNGEINANDIYHQECTFSPTESNVDYDFEATPNELNFGELEYNNTKMLSFDLINSSAVDIYYKLICTHRNWPLGNIEEDVKLHPLSETIFSGSRKKIIVSITPRTAVYYEFVIQYLIRISFRSDVLVARQSPIQICNVCCMCILPTIKVQNICAFGYNQNYSMHISKQFLWHTLQINRLNKNLGDILPGEKKAINIDLFPMLINEGTILIKWIIINPSTLPVSLALKRIKQCSCKPPKEETVIGMSIRYTLVGKTVICWDLDIGHDRHIILNVIINCLTESQSQDYFLSTAIINFGNIYFGNKGITYRAHWIFNITNNDLPYTIDTNNIYKINNDYQCRVFSCLAKNGIIKARTAIPLLFSFQPRMFGAYKVTFPITMGDKTQELTLKGEATFDFRSISTRKTIPSYCACKTPLFPAYFSVDCIDICCISTHNSIVKMLLIYNNLDFDALAYEWKCHDNSKMLDVDVFPRKGILHPNAVQSFRVKVYTKGYSCRISIQILCIFFNATKRRDYQRSIIKYNILNQELEGQFTITEKGIHVPKPWLKILDKPEQYYKTLSLRSSIYPVEDENIRVTLLEELKASPSNMIFFDDSKNCSIIKEKELYVVTFILEGLLWDIVNSERFKNIVENNLIPKRNLYYSQFMMDLSERRTLVRRSYISPPLTLIDSILEQMLFMIVHDEFSLKITHLIHNEDVRHRNYIKMLPKQKRTDLENNFKEANSTSDDEDESHSQHLRTGFRVSFV